MSRQFQAFWTAITSIAVVLSGCAPQQPFYFYEDGDLSHYVGMATELEHPDLEECSDMAGQGTMPPLTLENVNFDETWDLKLEDAVKITLENSRVMRTLGGRLTPGGPRPSTQGQTDGQITATPGAVLSQPLAIQTVYDPAIIESGPQSGVEAALSEFDAQLQGSLIHDDTDRPQNVQTNQFGGFFVPTRQQELTTLRAGITKRNATGGRVGLFSETIWDENNNPTRQVESDVFQSYEFQLNQPLLQGAGVLFNRIAGPFDPFNGDGTPNFDGVVLARINTDISLADFEIGVRDLVNDVEQVYWELYFAYRNLESRKIGRDSSLQTWRKIHALSVVSARGGEAAAEAQAREQYFFFRGQVEAALSELLQVENRLRYLMGIEHTDGRLIRPKDEPTTARVVFDWHEIHSEALVRSAELRQQKWRIKQRDLELVAAKNLLLPRLDLVARYRFLGLGDDTFGTGGTPQTGLTDTSAFESLVSGDYQETSIGIQGSMPIGFRRELSTIRNQELLLAESRVLLGEQELNLSHQLASALRDLQANYVVTQTNLNRRAAAAKQVAAVQAAYEADTVTLDLLLDAQRRLADAESSYYRSLVDYNRGIAQIHLRKGSLLEYNGVFLAEGPWPGKAYFDAHRLARQRDASLYLDYGFTRPGVFSQGPIEQQVHAGTAEGSELQFGTEEVPTPAPAGPAQEGELPEPADVPAPAAPAGEPGRTTRQPKVKQTPRNETRLSSTSDESSPFDWGFTLDASGRKPSAKKDTSVRQVEYRQEWKGKNEPVADHSAAEADRGASGWKRAQR